MAPAYRLTFALFFGSGSSGHFCLLHWHCCYLNAQGPANQLREDNGKEDVLSVFSMRCGYVSRSLDYWRLAFRVSGFTKCILKLQIVCASLVLCTCFKLRMYMISYMVFDETENNRVF